MHTILAAERLAIKMTWPDAYSPLWSAALGNEDPAAGREKPRPRSHVTRQSNDQQGENDLASGKRVSTVEGWTGNSGPPHRRFGQTLATGECGRQVGEHQPSPLTETSVMPTSLLAASTCSRSPARRLLPPNSGRDPRRRYQRAGHDRNGQRLRIAARARTAVTSPASAIGWRAVG